VECKLRCIDFRSVSDPGRAFRLAFRVTVISVDWYRNTMEVIVISLRTPQSARENFGFTWEHLETPATSLGAPTTSLRVPATSPGEPPISLSAPTIFLGANRITVEQSRKHIFFGNSAGAPGNHSYYLSFNDC
jgi:hypothetical protein